MSLVDYLKYLNNKNLIHHSTERRKDESDEPTTYQYLFNGHYEYLLFNPKKYLYYDVMSNTIEKNRTNTCLDNPLIIKYMCHKFNKSNICEANANNLVQLFACIVSNVTNYTGFNCTKIDKVKPIIEKISKIKPSLKVQVNDHDININPDDNYDLVYYFQNEYEIPDSLEKVQNNMQIGAHIIFLIDTEPSNKLSNKFIDDVKQYQNIYYVGNIFYGDLLFNSIKSIYLFKYSTHIPVELYNPDIYVSKIGYDKKILYLVREDRLLGGSKSRALVPYVQNLLYESDIIDELIYFGASNGYAQVAFAQALDLLKSKVRLTIYFQSTNLYDAQKIMKLAQSIYYNIKYIPVNRPMRDVWPEIESYVKNNPKSKLIDFGLNEQKYKQYFLEALGPRLDGYQNKIKRLWIVIGSGTLFSTLYKILPNTYFNLVQVGKDVDLNDYDPNRYALYKSKFRLYQNVDFKISYPTTTSYDGKIWEFRDKFCNDDWIWNTAGIHKILG